MRLDLGDLDLVNADGGYDSFAFFAQGEGVDFGEPQPIDVTLASLMADGAPTETARYENREVTFRVDIEASDALGLAAGEAALLGQIGVRTTLTWTPPDGYGPPTVFRVETSRARFLFNDLDEVRSVKKRVFQVTLTCLPFARSAEVVTVGAEFVADAVTIADDCESTSGWSATARSSSQNPVSLAVDSTVFATGTGSLKFTPAGTVAPSISGTTTSQARATRTGLSIDASGGGYFVVRVRGEWTVNLADWVMDAHMTTTGGGEESITPLVGEADEDGFTRLSFVVPNSSTITAFDINVLQSATGIHSAVASPKFWIDSLGLASTSSAPQNVMSFDVAGSMRCEASFQVSALVGLGDVLLYTVPDLGDGFRPDLRRRQVSGASTSDTAAINGTKSALSVSPTFSAPASMFRAGSYAVLARVRRSATGDCAITVSAQTKSGATAIGSAESTTSAGFELADADYHVVRIGVIELPPLVTDPASDATVLFTATRTGTDYYLDELLVFPLEDHALTWVTCGSGTPSATVASRLWIDEPSPTLPRGSRMVGNNEGRLDAQYVLPLSRGRHVLKPGRMLAYLLTSAAGGADLQAIYTPAWHSNAGQ